MRETKILGNSKFPPPDSHAVARGGQQKYEDDHLESRIIEHNGLLEDTIASPLQISQGKPIEGWLRICSDGAVVNVCYECTALACL